MGEALREIEDQNSYTPETSVAGGRYIDPDSNVVDWVNEKFTQPHENIQATLIKALEQAGIIKSIKEITKLANSLEHIGTIPSMDRGRTEPVESRFIAEREEELLLEFIEGEQARNEIVERVKNATAKRLLFSEPDEQELIEYIKKFRSYNPEFTPAYRVLRAMVGISTPEDSTNMPKTKTPEVTRELAPDVYFMLLKEEHPL